MDHLLPRYSEILKAAAESKSLEIKEKHEPFESVKDWRKAIHMAVEAFQEGAKWQKEKAER